MTGVRATTTCGCFTEGRRRQRTKPSSERQHRRVIQFERGSRSTTGRVHVVWTDHRDGCKNETWYALRRSDDGFRAELQVTDEHGSGTTDFPLQGHRGGTGRVGRLGRHPSRPGDIFFARLPVRLGRRSRSSSSSRHGLPLTIRRTRRGGANAPKPSANPIRRLPEDPVAAIRAPVAEHGGGRDERRSSTAST
jgi:hypothetical protein